MRLSPYFVRFENGWQKRKGNPLTFQLKNLSSPATD